jgi:arsenite oxidase small subunit
MLFERKGPEKSADGPMSKTSRRDFLKFTVLFGAAALLIPVQRITEFLYAHKDTGPITYPKTRVANSADIAAGESLLFTYPHQDRPAVLIHLPDGGFVAFDGTCTHLGCQVRYDKVDLKGWQGNPKESLCPCHGGVFDSKTGKVLAGPAPRALPKIKLVFEENGDIIADGYESGLPLYGEF